MKNFQDKLSELTADVKDLWGRAYRDSLTQLLNRAALEDVLLTQLNELVLDKSPFGLLYLDLNGFKSVNDTFGHNAGDQLLRDVAKRLQILHGDQSFRLGGDEFVIVIPKCKTMSAAFDIAEEIRIDLSKPYTINNEEFAPVAPSIGVVFCDDREKYDTDNAIACRDILHNGDHAMYQAKVLSKTSLYMNFKDKKHKPQGRCITFGSQIPVQFAFPELKNILRSGIGIGRILEENNAQDCYFKFIQYSDGDLQLSCRLILKKDDPTEIAKKLLSFESLKGTSFEGTVDNEQKCVISAEEILHLTTVLRTSAEDNYTDIAFLCSSSTIDFKKDLVSSVRFYISNFRFPNDAFQSAKHLTLDLGRLQARIEMIGGKKYHDELIEKLEKTRSVEVTCWADLSITSESQVNDAVEAIDSVCRLLTFLQGSRVSWISYDVRSSEEEVLQSYCRNSVTANIAEPDRSGMWTNSNLTQTVPKMYRNMPKVEEKWNLEVVLAFLSQAQDPQDYLEARACKTIQCIEILLNAYLCGQSKFSEERKEIPTRHEFSLALTKMCKDIGVACVKKADESEEDALNGIVNEVSILRQSLLCQGTFDISLLTANDDEMRQQYNSERLRRNCFLRDFIRECLRKILDPEGTYTIWPLYMRKENVY